MIFDSEYLSKILYKDIHLEKNYKCTLQNIMDKPVLSRADQILDDLCSNESETRRFLFKLVYSLCFVENNCTTYQGEYLYTVCPGSSDPPEKIFNIFASENDVYPIH